MAAFMGIKSYCITCPASSVYLYLIGLLCLAPQCVNNPSGQFTTPINSYRISSDRRATESTDHFGGKP
jgi:hypothetical protein